MEGTVGGWERRVIGKGGDDGEPTVMGRAGEPTNLLAPKPFWSLTAQSQHRFSPEWRFFDTRWWPVTCLFWEDKGSRL